MESFVYTASPSRVVFGPGSSSQLPDELSRQKLNAALILSTPYQLEQANAIKQSLGSNAAGIFSNATMHTPVEVTLQAVQLAKDLKADSVVSIGGGSTTGLGKAISIRTGLPHISIPTTYAGSEMTPILGETADGVKTTRRDPKILPGTVISDVNLTMSLPTDLSATSGINAIAHAVEALYAPDTNPIMRLFAKEGIRTLSEALVVIVKSSQDEHARSKALYGAWLCGVCLGSTSMSLHHKLCHTLGGSLNLPHAETHTILLPHTFAYNSSAATQAAKDVADALPDSDGDAIKGLNILLGKLGVKRALRDFGMKEDDIDRVASLATKNPYSNPRTVEESPIRELLRRAWIGDDAKADL
ncbi:putative maleylacetate reductase [Corynespora cassiicola Philippines]|uniref:Putative maleylacetate reductase n=1 Tax=Corynespora cassiicola Philippines TaxID=1448308 RepID=A0A2T2P836_CORCC|nr:putative maleylacetate reductase [Corynespora cassiicola Philippines]